MTSFARHPAGLLFILFCIVFCISYNNSASVDALEVSVPVATTIVFDAAETPASHPDGKYSYVAITRSCDHDFVGLCIPVYSGPGIEYRKIAKLRNGMVLKVKSIEGANGQIWYKVYFDEWLRHPERVEEEWYVPAVAGNIVTDDGEILRSATTTLTTKRIVVDLSDHMLYAYDREKEFMVTKISNGTQSAPTPLGNFTIYKKTPSRYMQGPIPGVNDSPFDLPGVPWNLYFTDDGAVIHGSYWHERYGTAQSSGCINLPPELAKILYAWAEVGMSVVVVK